MARVDLIKITSHKVSGREIYLGPMGGPPRWFTPKVVKRVGSLPRLLRSEREPTGLRGQEGPIPHLRYQQPDLSNKKDISDPLLRNPNIFSLARTKIKVE